MLSIGVSSVMLLCTRFVATLTQHAIVTSKLLERRARRSSSIGCSRTRRILRRRTATARLHLTDWEVNSIASHARITRPQVTTVISVHTFASVRACCGSGRCQPRKDIAHAKGHAQSSALLVFQDSLLDAVHVRRVSCAEAHTV
jgi:hypothetical protein